MAGLANIRYRARCKENRFGVRQVASEWTKSRKKVKKKEKQVASNLRRGSRGATTPLQRALEATPLDDLLEGTVDHSPGPFAGVAPLPPSTAPPHPYLPPTCSQPTAMYHPQTQDQNTRMGEMLEHYPVHLAPEDDINARPPLLHDPYTLTPVGRRHPAGAPWHRPATLDFLGAQGGILSFHVTYASGEMRSFISPFLADQLWGPLCPKPASSGDGEAKRVTVAILKPDNKSFDEVELWLEIVPFLGNYGFSLGLNAQRIIKKVRAKYTAGGVSDANVSSEYYAPPSPQTTRASNAFEPVAFPNPADAIDLGDTSHPDPAHIYMPSGMFQGSDSTNPPPTFDGSDSGFYASSQFQIQSPADGMQPGQMLAQSQGYTDLLDNFQPGPIPAGPYGYGPQPGSMPLAYQGHPGSGYSSTQVQQGQTSHTRNTFYSRGSVIDPTIHYASSLEQGYGPLDNHLS